jgi:putative endonuclease
MRQEKIFYVYIMASRSHQLYIGVTSDIEVRAKQHRDHRYKGWSDTYNCERLVWFQRFSDPNNAIARETQLKKWRREKKIALIERNNPTWQDLSEPWGKPVPLYQWPKQTAGSSAAPSKNPDGSGRNDPP